MKFALLALVLLGCGPVSEPEPPAFFCRPTLECCPTDGGSCWEVKPSCVAGFGFCPDRGPP